jgi:hypothetical protein
MPTYLVTDKTEPTKVLVEAKNPARALAAVVADRFECSDAMTAADAVRASIDGVAFIDTTEQPDLPGIGEPGGEPVEDGLQMEPARDDTIPWGGGETTTQASE